MSGTDGSFVAHVADLLAVTGAVATRRMFGGHGVYLDGLFIGIIAEDVLYLKVDAQTENEFRAAGSAPFQYVRQGRVMTLRFWSVPEAATESPRLMQPWARHARTAALRAATTGHRTKKTGRNQRPAHKTSGKR